MDYLEKEFEEALAGRDIWLKIKEKYGFTNGCGMVIFPSEDETLNRAAVELLPEYRKKVFLKKIIAVTDKAAVRGLLKQVTGQEIFCENLEQEALRLLLKYYRLVIPCAHISVVYTDEPYGEGNLLREEDVELEDFIMSAVYKVR